MDKRNPEYMQQVVAATARFAKSRDGELVLGFLTDTYVLCPFHEETLSRQAGRRDVVLSLLQMAESDIGSSRIN